MKTKSFLFLAGLVALGVSTSAATNSSEARIVVLPTCVVAAPRELPAEARVNASLQEFSRQATMRTSIQPELTLLKAQAVPVEGLHRAALKTPAVRLAKS